MQSDEYPNCLAYECQELQFYQSLTLKQISQKKPDDILKIIMEKDFTIQAFSQQITRFKAEQMKAKKLISSLQQKIQKTFPSGTNTSSTFMIASQFKTLFTTFMTNSVPSVFYDFTQHPKIYSLLLNSIMQGVYLKLQQILQNKTEAMRKILIEGEQQLQSFNQLQKSRNIEQAESLRGQIRYQLLNFLQKYCSRVFPSKFRRNLTENQQKQQNLNGSNDKTHAFFRTNVYTECELREQIQQKIETLNSEQTQQSDEIKQFCMQLYQICIYMILQQNPWQFVFNTEVIQAQRHDHDKVKFLYTKKEFTCIDGFAKEGNQVNMVLKGLRRKDNSGKEYHYHPNIRNFVLPIQQDEQDNPLHFQLQTDILFLASIKSEQKEQQLHSKVQTPKGLRDITNSYQNQMPQRLMNPPLLVKSVPMVNITSQNHFSTKYQNLLPSQKPQIVSEQSFRIEAIAQTQKSSIIQFLLIRNQSPVIENESNCIIDSAQSYTLIKKNHKKIHSKEQENKENFNENIIAIKPDKKLSTNSKKEKSLLEKNIMKKNKKQKNNSTIDLTTQKNKTNQKDNLKDQLENEIHKRKHDDLPLARDIPKSSKKKTVGKSSRKCSVGKIVSQSTQMAGSNINVKQKISLSQHNTLVMKQSGQTKALKDNYIHEGSQRLNLENKQNLSNFIGHMYEKQIIRPKKSTKISKNEEKQLIVSSNPAQKQERPLALRAYQNNCLVGKLREKYLIN